jgi:hypothetical protein
LALSFFLRALTADILQRLWDGQVVSENPDPREFPVDHAVMKHRTSNLTGAAPYAQIPPRLNQGHALWIGHVLHAPTCLVLAKDECPRFKFFLQCHSHLLLKIFLLEPMK